jgi:hypothetical protein
MMLPTLLSHDSEESSALAWLPLSFDTFRMPLLEMLLDTTQLSVPRTSLVATIREF